MSLVDGIQIFKNNSGTISSTAFYTYSTYHNPNTIDVADFNKDGWMDLVTVNEDSVKIFLNSFGSFSQAPSYSLAYSTTTLTGRKQMVRDLHNKGGLSVLYSGTLAINSPTNPYSPAESPWTIEDMIRFNPTTIDANPAPPYLFESYVQVNDSIYHPKLMLFNRGDRDFQKYRIYKKNWVTYHYYLFDSTTSDNYIDTTEDLLYVEIEPAELPPDNLFYYAVAVDNSYKVSITSDTISYISYVCPTCQGEIGPDNFIVSNTNNEVPKEYSIDNYPNPFNPNTKIKYSIPNGGNVKITIYNSIGQKVNELVNEYKNPGVYIADFNGSHLASGIYYYRLEAQGFVLTKKMLLIK